MVLSQTISNALTGIQVAAMSALALVDVAGLYNMADFMVRPDGSQQDPNHMIPQEKVLVMLLAFPFLTVVLAFVFAPRKNAALIAASTHLLYVLHQVVHYSTWNALFHPDSNLSLEFFILTKCAWAVVSLIIWYLESSLGDQDDGKKSKQP
eukprot:scaffold669_cov80-Cylindrotheca_fusiformis.AAC.2